VKATLFDANGAHAGVGAEVEYLRVSCAQGAGKMARTEVKPLARRGRAVHLRHPARTNANVWPRVGPMWGARRPKLGAIPDVRRRARLPH
jgi:hypothetical protein